MCVRLDLNIRDSVLHGDVERVDKVAAKNDRVGRRVDGVDPTRGDKPEIVMIGKKNRTPAEH